MNPKLYTNSKRTTFLLDADILEKVQDRADKSGKSLSQYINHLLEEHVGVKPKSHSTS